MKNKSVEKPIRIMIIDDETPITDLISRYLAQFSYSVVTFNDPETVPEFLDENSVDLIITDVHMPEVNGIKLMESIRSRHPEIDFIVMTGGGDVETAVRAMRLGAIDFLQKPLQFDRLKTALTEIERRRAARLPGKRGMTGTQVLGASSLFSSARGAGASIGSYHILRPIGEGAVGTVFLCKKARGNQLYAVKMLKHHLTNDEDGKTTVRRFVHEGNAISQLDHPNVVKFFEFGFEDSEQGKIPYMVMEYFDCISMKEVLNSPETLSLEEKISMIRQIASALEAIHGKKIYHRDIKPGNLLVGPDRHVKITDFGICHLPSSDLTITDLVMGTPLYMPPENLKRKKAAKTMDIYSLGVVSYELFLGVRPFDAPDFHLLIQKILHDYPIRPSVINPDFPCELETILARMLKKAPQQRYQNAAEIIDDLDGFVKANRRTGLFDRLRGLTLFSRNWK